MMHIEKKLKKGSLKRIKAAEKLKAYESLLGDCSCRYAWFISHMSPIYGPCGAYLSWQGK